MYFFSNPKPTTTLSISDIVELFSFKQSCIELEGYPPSCLIRVNLSSLITKKLSSSKIAVVESWPKGEGSNEDNPKIFK